MTLISVVLPVYGVAPYLRECLDSILDQDYADFEVVAVDDASPDECGEILDAYAQRYSRLRVEHLDRNIGLGPARGAGFELAKGDAVWFVDSDDVLADGALTAVAERLSTADLLLVDYRRDSWLGSGRRSNLNVVLPPATTPDGFTAAQRPGVFSFPHTAWSRVLRRELVGRAGFPFHPGWYEDVSFTFPLVVAAERISVLRRVCYRYRDLRPDAITRTRDERHFEVFDQYERLFATLDRWGVDAFATDAVRRHIFDRMVWHLGRILHDGERMPPERQRAFFSRMSEHYQRFQPAHTRIRRPALASLNHTLIKTDSWLTYSALRRVRRWQP